MGWLGNDGAMHVLAEKKLYDGVNLYGGYNILTVESDGRSMEIWIGEDRTFSAGTVDAFAGAERIVLSGTRDLKVEYMVYEPRENMAAELTTMYSIDEIESSYGPDASGMEGKWTFLDRDTNARWAEPGGKYRLAVMKYDASKLSNRIYRLADGREPVYTVLYMGNGVVNGPAWQPGMVKGLLYPTVFSNHYDLVWYDAYMEPMDEELSADLPGNAILSFNIPLMHSVMRFSRIQKL